MVNKFENGSKEYKQPEMEVVMIDAADIIATSGEGGTGGFIPSGGGVEDE